MSKAETPLAIPQAVMYSLFVGEAITQPDKLKGRQTMACLFKLNETKEWLNDWLQEGQRGARNIVRAAAEQRANKDSLMGRQVHWCDMDEYEQCVQLLEETARKLQQGHSLQYVALAPRLR